MKPNWELRVDAGFPQRVEIQSRAKTEDPYIVFSVRFEIRTPSHDNLAGVVVSRQAQSLLFP